MAVQSQHELNILLVGETGVGKSATGNSLLGRQEFKEGVGESVTKECKGATATRCGVQITVIDTPGCCDTDGLDAATVIDDYITTEKSELHAICLVMRPVRPTAEGKQAVAGLCKQFGKAMLQSLFIVITTAECLDRDGIKPKDFLKRFVTSKTDILHTCIQKDRVFGIDNYNDEKKKQQIQELLDKVNMMVSENKGAMNTLHILKQIKKTLEEEARILKEEKEKIQREKEKLRKRKIELEKRKAKEEESQKLKKEKEALTKKEEAIEEQRKQLDERMKQHNHNAERMELLKAAGKSVPSITVAESPSSRPAMAAKSQHALNILLVGKTGVGKSATGNSLLGREEFEDDVGASVTKACKQATATRDGVQITVIDTPGVFDTDGLDAAKVIDDYITTKKCELHAICLVMSPSRPTAEEKQAIAELCKLFGLAMLQYLIIVITTAENLERKKKTAKDFLKGFVTTETDVLHTCIQKDRVFGIDNFKDEKKKQQIQELLEKVNMMDSENKGAMYTLHILEQNKTKLEEEARRIKEEKEKIRREKEKQRKREIELEKEKAKEEERQKLQKDMEALEKKEEAIEEQMKQLAERLKQHNDNVKRMELLEAGKTLLKVGLAAGVAVAFAVNPLLGLAAGVMVANACAVMYIVREATS